MSGHTLEEIAQRHGIVLLLEFGSAVAGRLHARRDRDIAVLLRQRRLTLMEQGELTHDLQGLFPGREVDLAIVNSADPLFLKQITQCCRLLYGPPRRLHELRMYAFKRYQDHRRYLVQEARYVTRTLDRLERS